MPSRDTRIPSAVLYFPFTRGTDFRLTTTFAAVGRQSDSENITITVHAAQHEQ